MCNFLFYFSLLILAALDFCRWLVQKFLLCWYFSSWFRRLLPLIILYKFSFSTSSRVPESAAALIWNIFFHFLCSLISRLCIDVLCKFFIFVLGFQLRLQDVLSKKTKILTLINEFLFDNWLQVEFETRLNVDPTEVVEFFVLFFTFIRVLDALESCFNGFSLSTPNLHGCISSFKTSELKSKIEK